MLSLSNYQPASPDLWQGRQDTLSKERFYQRVEIHDVRDAHLTITQKQILLLGFCCDEGITRNEGRPGAYHAPFTLRQQLAKLPFHSNRYFIDIGNIACDDDGLEEAQQQLSVLVDFCHQTNNKTVIFGGGHEIAWGHFQGLANHYPSLGIINFDAHFDLRPVSPSHLGNSGTPFRQIAMYCKEQKRSFNYCCLGIQPHSNTTSLFEMAKALNVSYLTAQEMQELGLSKQIAFLETFINNHDAIYLTLCMDVFAESVAPGVSAPQALGLLPWQVIPLLKYIIQSGKVVSMDVAELSPELDDHLKTSRLAAMIMAELLEFY